MKIIIFSLRNKSILPADLDPTTCYASSPYPPLLLRCHVFRSRRLHRHRTPSFVNRYVLTSVAANNRQ
ncbi:hypothetical protein HanOQP8_Chr14g0539341 [Helianthus annuus]|nr:hypothetical protein HanOQP8_Chr14g0539341 [Helianthus annuus]